MTWLSYDEFLEQAPEEPGSIRINHDSSGCSGNSNSLKIERKDDGSVSAYCFRCGKRGFHTPEFSSIQKARDRIKRGEKSDNKDSRGYKRPYDTDIKTSNWPTYAIKWLKQWGVTNNEILKYEVGYSSYFDRLIFTIRWDSEYHGYASRACNPTDTKPKWLVFSDSTPFYTRSEEEEQAGTLVLVEDIISAIRVARYTDSLALLTTTIATNTLAAIASYDKFIVWLDDDNRQVKLNQLRLARRLGMFGSVKVIHHTDPKRCDDGYIKRVCL